MDWIYEQDPYSEIPSASLLGYFFESLDWLRGSVFAIYPLFFSLSLHFRANTFTRLQVESKVGQKEIAKQIKAFLPNAFPRFLQVDPIAELAENTALGG